MSSETTKTAASGGTSIAGLLGVAFVVLKLTHVIDWSWWYVTMPFWLGLSIVFGGLLIALIVGGVWWLIEWCSGYPDRRRRQKGRAAEGR